MEGSCSTGQSPQWAVMPVEEEEEEEEEEMTSASKCNKIKHFFKTFETLLVSFNRPFCHCHKKPIVNKGSANIFT
jgi:hypothetical protein